MVKKIFAFLNREWGSVTEAALLLGLFTFASQILALVRDRLLAHTLGPGASLDVYYAGFRIPDLLFNSVSTLVSVTVLLPYLMEFIASKAGEKNGDEEKAHNMLSQIFTVFIFGISIICVILFILMPYLAHIVAPGFNAVQLAELATVSRIMLLSPILLGLSNLFGSVSQLYKRFFVYGFAPVLYNLGIIIGVIFFLPHFGITGLAYGVVLGAILHVCIQIPVLIKEKFVPHFVTKIDWKKIKNIFSLSLPRTLALSLNSFAIFIIVSIASTLGEGAISIFNFSYNLQAVPIAIIGLSYGVAAFPVLAQAFARGDMELYNKQVISTARQLLFWALPVMSLFIVLRAQIVRVILGSGAFSWDNTRLTAASLAFFVISVIGQCFIILFVRAYYAAGKTKRPLYVNLIFTGSEIIFAFLFVYIWKTVPTFQYFIESLLRVEDVPGTMMLMLPLGYSLGTILNGVALWVLFKKDFMPKSPSILFKPFLESLASACVMGAMTYLSLNAFSHLFNDDRAFGILGLGLTSGIIGIFSGIIVLKVLKNQDYILVSKSITRKIFKAKVLGEEQKEL